MSIRNSIIDPISPQFIWDLFLHSFSSDLQIYMLAISLVGAVLIALFLYGFFNSKYEKIKGTILGAGLTGTIIGLIVFPISSVKMYQAWRIAAEHGQVPSFVAGGFYLTFIPLVYSLVWFLVSILFLLVLKYRHGH